ncbi:aminotransferase class V-fold PLP-dependent enzyme [Cellulosilyticum sp. I15G10I2]|uniref:aminotransferase class V-fold PLP-dependent enzyme n=1 Tax=Cellulosilyticum sp. I15G10I2 TaxID=1892843 RepID=UPI00085CD803|nr:aminotransferase class V-fold PLP-dependent enzyme [Cellulosilyticum sp. I15G10I2]
MKDIKDAANGLQNLTVDITSLIPTNNGNMFNIYFDNGATTPPMESVIKAIEEYTPWYKYVGNNSLKADFLAELYKKGRTTIKQYVGADMEQDIAIYTKNSTEAINILSHVIDIRYQGQNPVVITTYMEHLSNYFPWKYRFETVLADVLPDGRLSMTDLERKLRKYRGRVKLVAITGASNVTGYVNPIHDIARMAHRYGAEIFVDGAQLVQHRNIRMRSLDPKERIDYLSFSAHKIYAPAYSGVLIGPQNVFDNALPLYFGAGMESLATDQHVVLKLGPERYESGSNNLLGAIALSCSLLTIENTGMNAIRKHESDLLAYGINLLSLNANVILYGDTRCLEDRIPIISFNVRDKTYQETAEYLYDNYGIITKNGLCGADLYVQKLTEGTPYDGLVRVSMAFFNQRFELDRLANALKRYH